jgi:hypothetical protein
MAKTTFDRSQFKPAPIKNMKQKAEEEDRNFSTNKSNWHEVNDGLNTFRLYPAHPGQDAFYYMRMIHWLGIEVDGEIKRRPVMNARVHAGVERDVIEEYIKHAKIRIHKLKEDETIDELEASKRIKKLTDWKEGIQGKVTWCAYADKRVKSGEKIVPVFNILEMGKSVRDGVNSASFVEEEDEPINVDPFTDPDDGHALLIQYNSKAKKAADYYNVQVGKKAIPLTDEQLQYFSQQPTLRSLFENIYTLVDFDQALSGLRNFDIENEIDLFEDDEWLEVVKELKIELTSKSSGKKSATPAVKAKTTTKKAAVVEEEVEETEEIAEEDEPEAEEEIAEEAEPETDIFDEMDRNALKVYIKKEGIDFTVMTKMTDDDIREGIRTVLYEASLTEETTEEEPEAEAEEVEEEVEETKPVKKTTTAATAGKKTANMEDIRGKLQALKDKGKK